MPHQRGGAALLFCLAACSDPSLNLPERPAAVPPVFEPAGEPGAAPPNFRARLAGAQGDEPWLLRGALSDQQSRAIRQGALTDALRARAVPLRYWSHQGDLWLQPLEWLTASEEYSLALTGHGVVQTLHVAASASSRAERLFPIAERPVHRAVAMCGPRLPDAAVELAPAGIPLRVSPLPGSDGDACAVWVAEQALSEPALLPPSADDVLLAPALFLPSAPPSAAPACNEGKVLAGACVEVLDDRILLTALHEDSLWVVDQPMARVVVATVGRRTALIRGLTPQSPVLLRGRVLTAEGFEQALDLEVTTLPPQPHLILTEVLANPLGNEPACEWVELSNDSARPISLAGSWLADGGGRAALPSEVLQPGEIVLLVSNDFAPSTLDAPIPRETRLLRVPSLGTRGLSNSGEGLLLLGPGGVRSRFPSIAASQAGRSVARLSLDAHDDDPAAFGKPTPSPGAASWLQ